MKNILVLLMGCLLSSIALQAGGLMVVAPEGSNWQPTVITSPDILPRPRPMPPPPDFTPFQLEVKSEKAEVKIDGQTALTAIDQVFYNPSGNRLEGYFLFPIPTAGVIANFSMFINGKETHAELLDAKKARQIYEDIVRSMRDPALLEYSKHDLFKVRVFPIEPRSELRIKISYSEILTREDGTTTYIYPLNNSKHAAKPLQNLSLDIDLKTDEDLKSIYCPTHDAEIIRKGSQAARIGYEAKNVQPNTDFKLYFSAAKEGIGVTTLSYKNSREDGFFLLNINPGMEDKTEQVIAKDISFVLDVSGSMAGDKLNKAKEALAFCVNNLNSDDRFNVVRFSTEARSLFDELEPANKMNVADALKFIENLKPIGGTNIDEALEKALKVKTQSNRPYFIVFITDGKPTVGVTEEDELVKKVKLANTSNTRIFTFGIGEDLNTHLLDKITEATRAYRSYILPSEDIEVKISNFYTKISSPVLTDLQISFGRNLSAYEIYPKDLGDLFKGTSLTVMGRYKLIANEKSSVTIKGKVNGETRQFTYDIPLPDNHTDNEFIPPLWAARSVGYLLDQIRLHGEDKELVEQVVELAKKYGIVTPYTSYLILEDDAQTIRPPQPGDPMPHLRPSPKSFQNGSSRKEYSDMQESEGAGSVRSSQEVQSLSKADNIDQTRQGQSRMNNQATDSDQNNTLANQYRNIQGRAVYQTEQNQWIDSEVYNQSKTKVTRIQFASKEYFELLKNQPETAEFLALGRNVQFLNKGTVYDVYE